METPTTQQEPAPPGIALPSTADVRRMLALLRPRHLRRLAELSGIKAHTIYKIQTGATEKPALDTVGAFLPHIPTVKAEIENEAAVGRRAAD